MVFFLALHDYSRPIMAKPSHARPGSSAPSQSAGLSSKGLQLIAVEDREFSN